MELLNDGWTENDTAEVLGVSVRSIERWEVNLEVKGEVNPRSVLRGRPRILDPAVMEDLLALVGESPTLYLDEIVDYLSVIHNIYISRTALHNNLQALGLTYKRMQRTASQRDEEARQAWREDITANFSCDQLVFTDESSKDGRTLYRRSGRALHGKRPTEVAPLEWGERWSILPALTIDGYAAIRIVEGSVDGAEFYDFIVNEVVSLSPQSHGACWCLQSQLITELWV